MQLCRTGDAQLSVGQQARLSGAVVVSTPQDIALIDARRGASMFRSIGVPLLGMVENMSYYVCPKCGDVAHIFGTDGCETTAADLNLDLLGKVHLLMHWLEWGCSTATFSLHAVWKVVSRFGLVSA